MDAIEAISSRRTHKRFTGEPVTRAQLEQLLELATLAPNHKLTQPWRFFVVPHEGIPAFVEVVLGSITDADHEKLQRKRPILARRLPLLGAFVTVAREVSEDSRTAQEDYAACACAVHNMMIAATAMGLGSFWSTGDVFERPAVRAFLGIPEALERVASLWLGVPAGPMKTKRTPASELTTWVCR